MVVKVMAYILIALLVLYAGISIAGLVVKIVRTRKARKMAQNATADEGLADEDKTADVNK